MAANGELGYEHVDTETPQGEEPPLFPARASAASPTDRYGAVYTALLLCGVGFLLPYNCFITAADFYQKRFPASTIVFDMSLTYICVAFGAVLLSNAAVEVLSLQRRVLTGYGLAFGALTFVAMFDIKLNLFSDGAAYVLTLCAVAVTAFGCTVQQSSFYGYSGMLSHRYTQAVMVGESTAGLLVSVNRILTKALMHDTHKNTLIFFATCIVLLLLCCVAFLLTGRSRFVQHHLNKCHEAQKQTTYSCLDNHTVNTQEEAEMLEHESSRTQYGVLALHSPNSPQEGYTEFSHITGVANTRARCDEPRDPPAQDRCDVLVRTLHRPRWTWQQLRSALQARACAASLVWPYMVSIGLAYAVTLCLFPGIESEIVSCSLGSWMPVLLFFVFNLFDFIGKIFAAVPYEWAPGRLVLCCVGRALLVPALMACAAPRSAPLLSHAAWPVLMSALLGLSNGYFGSVPMVIAPRVVPDNLKELTGNIMALSYSCGLTTGSVLAYILDAWLGPRPRDLCLDVTPTAGPAATTSDVTTMGRLVPSLVTNVFTTVKDSLTSSPVTTTMDILNITTT